jgi:hypothetical protein
MKGISSSRKAPIGFPALVASSCASSSPCSSIAPASASRAFARSPGVVVLHAAGRAHGAVDIGLGGKGGVGDDLAGRRVEDGLGLSFGGWDVLAVDEVLKGEDARGHAGERQTTTATLVRAGNRGKG